MDPPEVEETDQVTIKVAIDPPDGEGKTTINNKSEDQDKNHSTGGATDTHAALSSTATSSRGAEALRIAPGVSEQHDITPATPQQNDSLERSELSTNRPSTTFDEEAVWTEGEEQLPDAPCRKLAAFFKSHGMALCLFVLIFLGVIIALMFTATDFTTQKKDPGAETITSTTMSELQPGRASNQISTLQWPSQLYHRVALPEGWPKTNTQWPTTTIEAALAGWSRKIEEDCVTELGELWLFQGRRNSMSSAALFFSPQIGDIPGVLTGIEVNYYERVLEGLVGSYFSEEKMDENSNSYHSVSVGFRDWKKQNLCDRGMPLPHVTEKFIAIAPQFVNLIVPTIESDSRLIEEWHEGSCLPGMGYHWLKSVLSGGTTLTYKSNTVVPVVVMYHPDIQDISGLFFWAPQRMQVWKDGVCNPALANLDMQTLPGCFSDMNFWDPGPGLAQMNQEPLFMCGNTCDVDCYFEDSFDGTITTMHFFFYEAKDLKCPTSSAGYEERFCRNGFDFTGWSHGTNEKP